MGLSIVNFPPNYYILRDRLPFFLLLAYLWRPHAQKAADGFSCFTIYSILVFTLLTIHQRVTGGSMEWIMGFNWVLCAPIEWGTYMITAFTLLLSRFKNPTYSALLSVATAEAGGWLHELPWFIMQGGPLNTIRINGSYTFFLSFQIICIPLSLYLLTRETEWTPKWYTYATLLLYLIYIPVFMTSSLRIYIQNPYWGNWLTRIPTILMLLGFIYPARRPPQ